MLPLICLVSYAQFLTQLAFIPVFKTLLRSLDCSQVEGFTVLKGDSPLDSPWRWDINPLLQDRETALHVDPSAGEKPVPRKKCNVDTKMPTETLSVANRARRLTAERLWRISVVYGSV